MYLFIYFANSKLQKNTDQKTNFKTNEFFEIFPESSLPSTVSNKKKTIKMIDRHACLRDVIGQPYPIYASTCANHSHALFLGPC